MKSLSLITIVYDQDQHLKNLFKGVLNSTVRPQEIIVVNTNSHKRAYEYADLNIITVNHIDYDPENLPIGESRNIGARHASSEVLCFLDVDCIPAPTFFEETLVHHENRYGLIMGQPRYLDQALASEWDNNYLMENSSLHPSRPVIKDLELTTNFKLFWSLCFSIPKRLFDFLGGFDPQYTGYGAEDTDLAYRCRQYNIPIYLSAAYTFQQKQATNDFPLSAFEPIVNNCKVFYDKWGEWPMADWLTAFRQLKLIDWDQNRDQLIIQGIPTDQLISQYNHSFPSSK